MKVEIKDYGKIGNPYELDLRVALTTIEDLENDIHDNEKIVWEGSSNDMPKNISDLHYYKAVMGHPAIYYVISDK